MLREMAEALEALTVERGLVLVLEDLHVSDRSTVELLAYLTQRRERAKLLVVGTYRLRDVVVREHPLKGIKQELDAHGHCAELRLELLSQAEVEEYVAKRLAANTIPTELTKLIYRRTDGNALFMVNVVDYCLQQHLVVQEKGQWHLKVGVEALGVPESVQQMIAKQIDGLSEDEQQVLEVASVAGSEFAVAAVATTLQSEIGAVEEICEALAQKSLFLREEGVTEWPDGTVSGRYAFRHVLYQNVLYNRIAAARRVRLHRLIGEQEEAGYGTSARTIAVELTMHFERGRDYRRAVQYLQFAGENAIQRSAYQEAMDHLTKGLELLRFLPDTLERARQELSLQVALSLPLMVTKTPATPELEKVYSRARALCEQVGATLELFPVLWNLWSCHEARAQWTTARELAEQLLTLAHDAQDSALLLQAHHAQWTTLVNLGELRSARAHFEQGLALYDPQQYRSQVFLCGGHDPGVCCRNISSLALWLLGYPDQALTRKHEALTLGQELSHPLSLAGALGYAAALHQFRREEQAVQTLAEAAIALSTKHELVFTLTHGTILWNWALAQQGRNQVGIAQIQQGLAARRARETEANLPYYLALLAEVYRKAGQVDEALSALAEALEAAHKTGERFYEAELYRLQGELTLQSQTSLKQVSNKSQASQNKSQVSNPRSAFRNPKLEEAEACFLKAIEIARRQQAKSLELRATMSLARLWQQQAMHPESRTTQHETRLRLKEAHSMLSKIYNWFTEGFDTKDLQEAKTLIEDLSH
jgi:predicted ATPase